MESLKFDKLRTLLETILSEDWAIDLEYPEAVYDSPIEYIEIRLDDGVNEFGVHHHTVTLFYADKGEGHVLNPSEAGQHYYDLDSKEWEELEKEMEGWEDDLNNWEKKEGREIYSCGLMLKVEPWVLGSKCYLNVPHYHYYKGWRITLGCNSIDEVRAFLEIYDIFIEIAKTLLPL